MAPPGQIRQFRAWRQMNGAPIPADPTAPPHMLVAIGAVFVGLVFVYGGILVAAALERRKQKLLNKQEVLARAVAQEREEFEHLRIQTLINQSPGGRKPWQ